MKDIVGYYCMNCGKHKGVHKADTLNCPNKGRGSFKGFSTESFYKEDKSKPIYGTKL